MCKYGLNKLSVFMYSTPSIQKNIFELNAKENNADFENSTSCIGSK